MAAGLIQFLQTMVAEGGSDLHLSALSPPMMRVRGEMKKIIPTPLTSQEVEGMVAQITTQGQKTEIKEHKSADFSFKAQGVGIFRVNVFTQRHGLSVVMRVLTEKPPTIESLNLPDICKASASYANGLVLVTGPTGSGKSTTLAAILNYINESESGHILTLEDPIEFQHESKAGMVNQRALNQHFTSFASAMKAALREDPDVILVGEMRDPETIALAIKAAETGHLVFSTLHTNSAAKTIDRIINSFSAEEQPQIRTVLSETLKCVISQKLVPSADGKRRICIHDIMVNNAAVANLIREGKTYQIPSIMQTGKREGMLVMDRTLLDLVQKGEVKGEVAWEFANDKSLFAKFDPAPNSVIQAPSPMGQPSATGTTVAAQQSTTPGLPPGLKKTG